MPLRQKGCSENTELRRRSSGFFGERNGERLQTDTEKITLWSWLSKVKWPTCFRTNWLIFPGSQIYRVPNEGERAPGLAAMLRAESKQDDSTLAHLYFGKGNTVIYSIFTAQPARSQHVVLGIASNDMHLIASRAFGHISSCRGGFISELKRRAVNEVAVHVVGHCPGNRIRRIHL